MILKYIILIDDKLNRKQSKLYDIYEMGLPTLLNTVETPFGTYN